MVKIGAYILVFVYIYIERYKVDDVDVDTSNNIKSSIQWI